MKANSPEELMEWMAAGTKPKSEPPVAGSATGYLPWSSVKSLLAKWQEDMVGWEASAKSWLDHQNTPEDSVRMNCCRVRARTLATVIEDIRAEMARTNKRQPEDHDQAQARDLSRPTTSIL